MEDNLVRLGNRVLELDVLILLAVCDVGCADGLVPDVALDGLTRTSLVEHQVVELHRRPFQSATRRGLGWGASPPGRSSSAEPSGQLLLTVGMVGRIERGDFAGRTLADEGVFDLCEQVSGGVREHIGGLDQVLEGAA